MSTGKNVTVRTNPSLQKNIEGATAEMIDEFASVMVEQLKQNVPQMTYHDTGNNRRSITHEQTSEGGQKVYTESGYGAYLELGTSRLPARPYFAPCFSLAQAEMARKYPGVWKNR